MPYISQLLPSELHTSSLCGIELMSRKKLTNPQIYFWSEKSEKWTSDCSLYVACSAVYNTVQHMWTFDIEQDEWVTLSSASNRPWSVNHSVPVSNYCSKRLRNSFHIIKAEILLVPNIHSCKLFLFLDDPWKIEK